LVTKEERSLFVFLFFFERKGKERKGAERWLEGTGLFIQALFLDEALLP